jgi:hypothetical protein
MLPSRARTAFFLLLLFAFAFLLRFAYISQSEFGPRVVKDAREYVTYGINLAFHGVYSKSSDTASPTPDSARSPGYPLVIALCVLLAGTQGWLSALMWTHVFFGALMAPLAWALGRRFLPPWGAWTLALLTAVSPHLVAMCGNILTETLFGPFLLLSVVLAQEALAASRPRRVFTLWTLAGVSSGMAWLLNETALLLPPALVLLCALWPAPRETRRLAALFLFLTVFSLFPAGWMLRNSLSVPPGAPTGAGRAISTMSHGAYPGFVYKNPAMRGMPYWEDPAQPGFGSSLEGFFSVLLERARARPLRYLSWYLFEKPYYLWSWSIIQGQGDIYVYPVTRSLYQISPLAGATRLAMRMLHPAMLFLAFAGFACFAARLKAGANTLPVWQTPALGFLVFTYYTVLYTVFAPWPRYSVPLRPFLYAAAVWCACFLWTAWKNRSALEGGKANREGARGQSC